MSLELILCSLKADGEGEEGGEKFKRNFKPMEFLNGMGDGKCDKSVCIH